MTPDRAPRTPAGGTAKHVPCLGCWDGGFDAGLTKGQADNDICFRHGLALGHRRERAALRPRLVRAWEDGHRRGVLVGLGVVLGLILCARWLGRTRCR